MAGKSASDTSNAPANTPPHAAFRRAPCTRMSSATALASTMYSAVCFDRMQMALTRQRKMANFTVRTFPRVRQASIYPSVHSRNHGTKMASFDM